jgi:hypothetical protein
MAKRLSVYLDLIRILTSIVVLPSHLLPTFHLGPPEPVYGHDAVMFFFVLSGFVIAFVCDTRETRPGAYACFGALCFLNGRRRWLGTLALALLAGPRVIALAPCWLAGVALYHAREKLVLRPSATRVLFAGSVLAFATLNHFELSKVSRIWLRALTNGPSYHLGSSQGLIGDDLLTLAVFANFTAAANLPALLRALDHLRRPVVAAASLTLSVYLYYMPLLVLAVWLFGLSPESGLRGAGAATAVMLPGIELLWPVTDRQRWRLRAWLESFWLRSLRTSQNSPAAPAQS